MTVSRYINDSERVSQKTRERVEEAIAELGYVPNALARSLRLKQTKTIALVLADITNPFFTTIARGVEDVASEQGFSVIFCNTDESKDDETRYLNVLVQKQVDGVLLVPTGSSSESAVFLHRHKVPFVVLDRRIPDVEVDTVRSDSEQGAYELVRHLLGLGHRRIAVLSGQLSVTTAVERINGYNRALESWGLDHKDRLVLTHSYTPDGGYQMAKQVMAEEVPPTAIFAGNNFIAIGVLHALRDMGLSVPKDISLVAFDDFPPTMTIEPFFTVAVQPVYEMGCKSTLLLLDRLSGRRVEKSQDIVLPARLIIRKSSGVPPRR